MRIARLLTAKMEDAISRYNQIARPRGSPTATSTACVFRQGDVGPRAEILGSPGLAQAAAGDFAAARATFARALVDAGLSVKNPYPEPGPLEVAPDQNMSASARRSLAEIQAMAGDISGSRN